ncbi:MAG TPA: enoyl-CoA-hydratase DpgB [Streptosporangiaceae bacterium]|nr:enoyl-CoA-hydratase DpgB [Streptosporangiaceae bacterium]
MVTNGRTAEGTGTARAADKLAGTGDLAVRIDGRRPMSVESVAAIEAVCDNAEDCGSDHGTVVVHVSGAPAGPWARSLSVALVSKWERGLRRLERLPATSIAVATGDCGGLALDALLATDYRIAAASARLLVPVGAGATWPGMALYRLCHQAGGTAIRRAVLFGAPIDASDALALGLVDELTDDTVGALAAAADVMDAFLGAELAIRRQLMLDATTVSFEDALGRHLAACDRELRRYAGSHSDGTGDRSAGVG